MTAREFAQLRQRRLKRSRRPAGKYVARADLMAIENVRRNVKLAPRYVDRESAQDGGNAGSDTGGAGGGLAIDAAENLRRQGDERRGRVRRIAFQLGHPRHRIVIEIEAPRLD